MLIYLSAFMLFILINGTYFNVMYAVLFKPLGLKVQYEVCPANKVVPWCFANSSQKDSMPQGNIYDIFTL